MSDRVYYESNAYIKFGFLEHFSCPPYIIFFCFLYFALKISIDKTVYFAIHYGGDIAVLIACSVILDKRIRHEYIGTNLRAPFDICLFTLDVLYLVEIFTLLYLGEFAFQHFQRRFLILKLAAFCLTADNYTCRIC